MGMLLLSKQKPIKDIEMSQLWWHYCLYVYPSIYLSSHQSIYLSIHHHIIYLSLYICLCIYLPIYFTDIDMYKMWQHYLKLFKLHLVFIFQATNYLLPLSQKFAFLIGNKSANSHQEKQCYMQQKIKLSIFVSLSVQV